MIIHTTFKKPKAKKPTAKQRQMKENWEKMLKKYEPKKPLAASRTVNSSSYSLGNSTRRETPYYPSLNSGLGNATKPIHHQKVYTGTAMKGIGTMHKSNSVPIFSDEEAVAIATMRRN
jgi:hypothetical protein